VKDSTIQDEAESVAYLQAIPSMSGRRLLDAAKLFNASRSIAKQHIQLRTQQLDVYSQTSTLAKAVKDQTDRVTLTAQAAIAIARKLNQQAPTYSYSTAYPPKSEAQSDGPIPREESVRESNGSSVSRKGLMKIIITNLQRIMLPHTLQHRASLT